jgi:hypothetical protein
VKQDQVTIYLCGSMTGLTHDQIGAYYRETVAALPEWMTPIAPLRDKDILKNAGALRASDYDEGAYGEGIMLTTRGIFARDSFDVRRSDALLADFSRANRVSIGSMFEIAWAQQQGKPIVIIMDKDGLHDHPFVRASTPFIFEPEMRETAIKTLVSLMRKGL